MKRLPVDTSIKNDTLDDRIANAVQEITRTIRAEMRIQKVQADKLSRIDRDEQRIGAAKWDAYHEIQLLIVGVMDEHNIDW